MSAVSAGPENIDAVDAVVLVPIKAFHLAKGRLAPVLDVAHRDRLARWTAERVLAAAAPAAVAVVCDDAEVATWAAGHGALVLREVGVGLNAAVDHAVGQLRAEGHEHVVVAHGDLPCPPRLASFARSGTVTLVPDRRSDGTNLLSFPLDVELAASYGGGSFRRHLEAAMRTGCSVEVIRDPLLALDIDHPSDLSHPLVKDVLPPWLRTNPDNPSPTR